MKTNSKFLVHSWLVAFLTFTFSCKEDEFLKEVPLDFYSPENSYVTNENFQAALTDLDARVRAAHNVTSNGNEAVAFLGTDIAYNGREDANNRVGDYNTIITPQNGVPKERWVNWYKIISNANTIISRLPASKLTEEQKKLVQAEAKLFRAWAYRHLVYLFGGVPLVLEESISPKADFERASREEVLNQIVADATEAAANLPGLAGVKDGKLSKVVANHLLAETYITLKDYDKAIAAATEVIEKSGLKLMTTRFGSLRNQPGDVYYDLFRVNNQNRGQGNTEAIWVAQYEVDVPGGALLSSGGTGNMLERNVVSAAVTLNGPDGKAIAYKNLAASTLNAGGRGASFIRPTNYYLYTIWGLNPAADNRVVNSPDIRTSKYNIVRDFIYTNPASQYFGKSMLDFPSPQWKLQDWRWYPYPSKVTTPGQHPEPMYDEPAFSTLKTTAGATFRDDYIIRLPETLLLRAEAYFLKGNVALAAKDINVIRARANATPVDPKDVNLEYILDERARELTFEEDRRIVLNRMGLLVERVRKYNPLNKDDINDHNNLFPIPYSEIEANKDATLEQNPGYL
jgi:starch-binding outer membrane protein, SusD/RagB family